MDHVEPSILFGTTSSTTRFLRLPTVLLLTGLSRTTVYRMVMADTFPAPVRLGKRAVGWRDEDVRQWMDRRRTH
jgi:prophage regulatory protein